MDFYKVFADYVDYIHSVRKLENFLSFDMKFPSKWGLPKSYLEEGKLVPFDTGDENSKGFSFVCSISEKEVNDVLLKISKAIKLNKDREIKDRLFKETVDWMNKEKRLDSVQLKKEKQDIISEIKKISKKDLFPEPKKLTLWQKIKKIVWGL